MAGRPSVLALLALLAAQGRVAAAPGSPAPILDSRLSRGVRSAVERSFPLAHQRIGGYRACGGLFARLGAEGTSRMAATSYHPATPEKQRRHCRGTTHAFTRVGDTRVALCPSCRTAQEDRGRPHPDPRGPALRGTDRVPGRPRGPRLRGHHAHGDGGLRPLLTGPLTPAR